MPCEPSSRSGPDDIRKRKCSDYYQSDYGQINMIVSLGLTSPTPPGKVYGELFRNRCPTCEHGTISMRPPHCHIRNDISKLSPPQIFILSSYEPSSKKYFLSMENSPPAMAGDGNGCVISELRFFNSPVFIRYHLLNKYTKEKMNTKCAAKILKMCCVEIGFT